MQKTTPLPSAPLNWRWPLISVVAAHLLLATIIIFTPSFSSPKPRFENIYTVDLIEVPLPAPLPTAPPKKIVIKMGKKIISTTTPKASAGKPISLSPKKMKVKKKSKIDSTALKRQKEQQELRRRREELSKALHAEAEAEQAARDAEEALAQERELYKQSSIPKNAPNNKMQTAKSGASARRAGNYSSIEAQWFAQVKSHVLAYWSLPDLRQWDPSLTATVVITVNQDGKIINSFFEEKSGDKIFDQFVGKSLQDATPLPVMPAAMKKYRFEFGLRFSPGMIQ